MPCGTIIFVVIIRWKKVKELWLSSLIFRKNCVLLMYNLFQKNYIFVFIYRYSPVSLLVRLTFPRQQVSRQKIIFLLVIYFSSQKIQNIDFVSVKHFCLSSLIRTCFVKHFVFDTEFVKILKNFTDLVITWWKSRKF